MDWSTIARSLTHPKTLINLAVFGLAGYGLGATIHLPTDAKIILALVAVIINQIGLQQQAPGA